MKSKYIKKLFLLSLIKRQLSSICTSLWCVNSNGTACLAIGTSAGAEGTTCGIGKICIKNKCVKSELVSSNETCLFNDKKVTDKDFSNFKLPYSPMDCDAYLQYLYTYVKYDNGLGCTNNLIKSLCCKTCKSKY
jgi:hypothetical protein